MRISDWSSDGCSSDLIGPALALMAVAPADDSQGGEDAALLVDALWNGAAIEPLLDGRYPEILAEEVRPFVEEGDLERIHQKPDFIGRSEEHTSELQSLMRISYAVFCLKKKNHAALRHNHKNTTRQ